MNLLRYLKEANWKQRIDKAKELGIINEIEGELLTILKSLEEAGINLNEIPGDFLFAIIFAKTENKKLVDNIIGKYFEHYIKEGKVFYSIKNGFIHDLEERLKKILIAKEDKICKVKVGKSEIELPTPERCNIQYVGYLPKKKKIDKFDIVYELPHLHIYVLDPDSAFYPAVLITKEKLPVKGDVEIYKKEIENPFEILDESTLIDILRKVYRGKLKVDEIRNELYVYPNSKKIRLYTTYDLSEKILSKLSVEDIKWVIDRMRNEFDLRWALIGQGLAVQPPKIIELLPYGTHALIVDATKTGKTTMGRTVGIVIPSATIPSLVGYATPKGKEDSLLKDLNISVFLDELEEEGREYGRYFLDLLREGYTEVWRAGKSITTYFWGNLVFTANAKAMKQEEVATYVIRIGYKITPNLEALSPRLAVFDYYNFSQAKKTCYIFRRKYAPIIRSFGKKLGEVFALLIEKSKIKAFLDSPWDSEYLKQLKSITSSIEDEQLSIFAENFQYNEDKMNSLALKIALWDFPELIKEPIINIEDAINEKIALIVENANDHKRMLEGLITTSLEKLSKVDLIYDVLIEERFKLLRETPKKLLQFLVEVYEKFGKKYIDSETIKENKELLEIFQSIFSRGYSHLSKVISKIKSEDRMILQSYGLEIKNNSITIVNESRWQRFVEFFKENEL